MAIGSPLRRSDSSAASIAMTISRPSWACERGSAARADRLGEVGQLEAERLGRLEARDDHVAAAVGELVLAERLRDRELHAAVEDADGLVGGVVVVLDHPLAADDRHLAHLARREPGDLDVGALAPLANVSVRNAVSGMPAWKTLRPVAATATMG